MAAAASIFAFVMVSATQPVPFQNSPSFVDGLAGAGIAASAVAAAAAIPSSMC